MSGRGVAILAALPREVRGLVGGARPDAELKRRGIFLYRLPGLVVVAGGMGAARVSLAFEAAVGSGSIAEVISTGLAGACVPGLVPGAVVEAGRVIDAQTGERFATTVDGGHVLVSAVTIASVREKARLAQTYHAEMVDMEAATVARLAQAHGLGFRALKGISDGHDFELAALSRFADARGQFRTGAFALQTALRPSQWAAAAKLGSGSSKALAALQAQLRRMIAQRS